MTSDVPQYRLPSGIKAAAKGGALVIADNVVVGPDNVLPVMTDLPVPGDYGQLPTYRDEYGVQVRSLPFAIVLPDGSIVGPGNPLPTTGGGGGSVAASDVTVTNPGYDNAQEIFDALLYVPLQITAFVGGSNNEIGSTVDDISLDWTYNKAVTSQSIDQGIGSLDPSLRFNDIHGAGLTSNTTYTLSATDGTTPRTAGTTVAFLPKRYWGPSSTKTPDNAQILALSQELSTARAKAVTYDCTGGAYPVYAWPKSEGLLANVTVGGLAFSDYTINTVSLTNASGHVQDYYQFTFNGIQTGANINVVFT